MNMTFIQNPIEMRKAFMETFTMTWDAFRETKWGKNMSEHIESGCVTYENRYLWELMEYRCISFSKSLECLRALSGEVYLMSENESKPSCQGIEFDGTEYKGGVAKMNAQELADLIEYEWYESYRLDAVGMYLTHTVLPADLYVFDETMEHLLVFTHETDYWELEDEQPMKCAASRFCMMHGFELPEAVSYDAIKTMLLTELDQNAFLEIEISYSCSMYFRQFIVSKCINSDHDGYEYWFDFDANTHYFAWEEAENAKVFNGLSLKEISELQGVRFDIMEIIKNYKSM